METKLITKTIKELADEFDGNVEQLHRTIAGYEKLTRDQKTEIRALNFEIDNEKWVRERAEKRFEVSFFAMYASICVLFAWIARNILIG